MTGERRSVAPAVLARIPRVFATNERVALALDGPSGRAFLVMVGALNVGRIRVVGVEPGTSPAQPLELARGAELARFEMGSTVVLVVPGVEMPALEPDAPVRLGTALARFR
jgi:phosphatidylserine decarboxylase